MPPSRRSICPFICPDEGLTRKTTPCAISHGSAKRPRGVRSIMGSPFSGFLRAQTTTIDSHVYICVKAWMIIAGCETPGTEGKKSRLRKVEQQSLYKPMSMGGAISLKRSTGEENNSPPGLGSHLRHYNGGTNGVALDVVLCPFRAHHLFHQVETDQSRKGHGNRM